MQSGAWMAVQQALGDDVVHERGEGWRFSAVVHRGRGLRWLYAPYGPAIEDPGRLGEAVAAVRDAGVALKADFVRVEPDLEEGSAGLGRTGGAGGATGVGGGAGGATGVGGGAGGATGVGRGAAEVAGADEPGGRTVGAASGPDAEGVLAGLKAVRVHSIQPRHTLVIDLRRSEEELRGDMLSGRRRSINAAERKGIQVRRTRELGAVEEFIRLIRMTSRRNRFDAHPDSYYRTVCRVLFERSAASVYLAEVGGQSVAGIIAFESPTTGYYAHAADDPQRSRQIVAAAPLAWRIVLDCRAEGRSTFDFWGVIPDDDAEHPWAGFSRFKKSFGGRLVTRPGTFDLAIRPVRYRVYEAAREARARRTRRGVDA